MPSIIAHDAKNAASPNKTTGTDIGTDKRGQDMVLYDSGGNEVDFSNIELQFSTPLKADRITSISTDGGSVAQTGILFASIVNTGNTTIIIWFGEAPSAGKSIYLSPGMPWSGNVNNKSGLYYDSDAAGGQLDYDLRGIEG